MLKNFILLHGSNDFAIHEKIQFFQKAFRQKYPQGEIEKFDSNNPFSQLENAIITPNLFAAKRLIITQKFWTLDHFETAQKSDFFAKVHNNADSSTIIALEGELDKRTKSTKFFQKEVTTQHFPLLDETQICDWIIRYTEAQSGTIKMPEAKLLLARCGENCWNLSQEIKKCLITHPEKIITKQNIEALTIPHPKVIIWDFLTSLSKKQAPTAITHLRNLIQTGQSAHMLFAMIIREIRIHTQIRAGLDQNLSPKDIATKAKLHPFVVQKTVPLTKGFSQTQIIQMYESLTQIDRKLKTGSLQLSTDDQSEFELALEKFILQNCQ